MARLINDSGVLGDAIEVTNKTVSQVPFNKVIEAINVIQTRMGITGTTAKEAGQTISGSVGAMKSAWTNLVTGFADGSADIGGLIDDLVTTIVGDGTENNLGVIGNVLPAIEMALGGIVELISGTAPKIIEILPTLVEEVVPSLITAATNMTNAIIAVIPSLLNTIVGSIIQNAPALITAAVSLVKSLIQGIKDNYQILVDGAIDIVVQLVDGILNMLPEIVQLGLDLIVSLVEGIAEAIENDDFINSIVDVILQIVNILTNQEMLTKLLGAAFTIITKLAWGLVENINKIIDATVTLLDGMIDFFLLPENLAMLVEAAIELVLAIGVGLIKAIPQLLVSVGALIDSIFTNFVNADWGKIGKDLVDGFKKGIQNAWGNLKTWFKNLFDDLIGIAKKILGIASPSKVFKKLGGWTAEGFGIGFEDAFGDVEDDIENALDFGDADYGITTSSTSIGDFSGNSSRYGNGGYRNVNVTVGIDDTANAMGLARELLPFLKIAEKEVYA